MFGSSVGAMSTCGVVELEDRYGGTGMAYLSLVKQHCVAEVVDYLRVAPRLCDLAALYQLFPQWFWPGKDMHVVLVTDAPGVYSYRVVRQPVVESRSYLELVGGRSVCGFDSRQLRLGSFTDSTLRGVVAKEWSPVLEVTEDLETVEMSVVDIGRLSGGFRDPVVLSHVQIMADVCPEMLPTLPGFCYMQHIPVQRRSEFVQQLAVEPTCQELAKVCERMYLPPAELANIAAERTARGWHLYAVDGTLKKLNSTDVVDEVLGREQAWRSFVSDAAAKVLTSLEYPVTFADLDLGESACSSKFWQWASGLVQDSVDWYLIQQFGAMPDWVGEMRPGDKVGRRDEVLEMVCDLSVEVNRRAYVDGAIGNECCFVVFGDVEWTVTTNKGVHQLPWHEVRGMLADEALDTAVLESDGLHETVGLHGVQEIAPGRLVVRTGMPDPSWSSRAAIPLMVGDDTVAVNTTRVDTVVRLWLSGDGVVYQPSRNPKVEVVVDWHDVDVPREVDVIVMDEIGKDEVVRMLEDFPVGSKYNIRLLRDLGQIRMKNVWFFRFGNGDWYDDPGFVNRLVRKARVSFVYVREVGILDAFVSLPSHDFKVRL